MQRNEKIYLEIEQEIIKYLAKFGWLRTIELAVLVYKKRGEKYNKKNAESYALELTKKMESRGLIGRVRMDDRLGIACWLKRDGAKKARKMGIEPVMVREEWKQPGTWKHELMSAALLIHLRGSWGYDSQYSEKFYMTERELFRAKIESTSEIFEYDPNQFNGEVNHDENFWDYGDVDDTDESNLKPRSKKPEGARAPDVVIKTERPKKEWIGIEVENADKRGKKFAPMGRYMCIVNNVGAKYGFKNINSNSVVVPDKIAVAYDAANRDKTLNDVAKELAKVMRSINHSHIMLSVFEMRFNERMELENVWQSSWKELRQDNPERFIEVITNNAKGLNDDGIYDPDQF